MGHFIRGIASNIPLNWMRVLLYRLMGVKISKRVEIGRGAFFGPKVVIGEDVIIGSRTKISNSIIGNGTKVQENVTMNYSRIGQRALIQRGSVLDGNSERYLEVGDEVIVGCYWILDGFGGLVIEDHVDLGSPAGSIFTHSSLKKRLMGYSPTDRSNLEKKPVRIGACSWLGGKVTVQLGVNIGDHSAVMPNSVVTKDVRPFTMVGGNPAKELKRIEIKGNEVRFLPIE